MADLRITDVPQTSSVVLSDDLYIKTGDTFRRVPVEKLADLFAASGFYVKPAGGIPQTDLEIEDVVIVPYGDGFISSLTYDQIANKEAIGVKLAPVYRPEYGIEYRGVTLEVENGAAAFAFLIPGDPAYIYVFAVTDLDVSKTQIPLSGGSGGASTNAEMGIGIAQCNTPAGTAAKEASMTGYVLVQNGFVAVRFTYSVPASATLSINGQDAKAIYWMGNQILGDVITARDIAILVYDGTNYQLVAVLPSSANILELNLSGTTAVIQKSYADIASVLTAPWQAYFYVQIDYEKMAMLHATVLDDDNLQIYAEAVVGNTRYSILLTQAGTSPDYYMTGTLVETPIGGGISDAVTYSAQTGRTDAEKAQARTNIGALGASDIGTVFTLKGSVATVAALPATGNSVGDVYYVDEKSVGYVWLTNTTYPNGYWEELGETIDLSAYQEKPVVVEVTGNTPTIALAENNKIYKCTGSAITSVTITARDTNAAFSIIFDSPGGVSAPTFSYPVSNMYMPDDFALEVYRRYEINVDSDGYAVAASWSFD